MIGKSEQKTVVFSAVVLLVFCCKSPTSNIALTQDVHLRKRVGWPLLVLDTSIKIDINAKRLFNMGLVQ